MIDYQESQSPFYLSNKTFIEGTISSLTDHSFSGWVNAYGFDVEGKSVKQNYSAVLSLKKHQTSQNGVLIPIDAHVNSEMELVITGLKNTGSYQHGVGLIEKLATLNFGGSDSPLSDRLNQFVKKFGIQRLTLKNGKLSLKVSNSTHSPVEIVEELDQILN